MKKIICVLVVYNPDMILLLQVIDAILPQVDLLWISDNSENAIQFPSEICNDSKIIMKKMPGNIGIAAAQNVGIQYALDHNFDFLFFLDQDSIPPKNIVYNLLAQYTFLTSMKIIVGAVGPRPYNRGENKEYRGSIKKGKHIADNLTEVTELISSASFIHIDTFKNVGLMDEKLFIDGVDHEWCWRANYINKSRFFIIENIKLSHQLGEGDRWLLFKKIAIPTAFRTYYQYRNYFILTRKKYVPLYWKIANGFKYLIKFFYYPLCISPRKKYLYNIINGIHDGIFIHKP